MWWHLKYCHDNLLDYKLFILPTMTEYYSYCFICQINVHKSVSRLIGSQY